MSSVILDEAVKKWKEGGTAPPTWLFKSELPRIKVIAGYISEGQLPEKFGGQLHRTRACMRGDTWTQIAELYRVGDLYLLRIKDYKGKNALRTRYRGLDPDKALAFAQMYGKFLKDFNIKDFN